jgi:hypothetical protein
MFTRVLIASAIVILGGCSREPATPTAEENRQLEDAANLLNEAPANLDTVDDMGLEGTNSLEPEPY